MLLDEKNIEKSIRSTNMFLKGMTIGFRVCTGKARLINFEGLEAIIYQSDFLLIIYDILNEHEIFTSYWAYLSDFEFNKNNNMVYLTSIGTSGGRSGIINLVTGREKILEKKLGI